MTKMNMISRLF